jgi:predicted amidohydrolase
VVGGRNDVCDGIGGGVVRVVSWATVLIVLAAAVCGGAARRGEVSATLRVASLMVRPVKWDKAANKGRLEGAIREAKGRGAELVVTPEGALEGYVVNEVIRAKGAERRELTEKFNALAEPVDGPYVEHFRALCRELEVHLVLGFLEADGGKTYNTAVLIGPDGEVVGKYRKTHFAQGYSNGDEKGDNPPGYLRGTDYPVFEVGGRKMGIMICFDRREPVVAKRLVENGAEFIVNPAYGMMGDCNCEFLSSRAKETGVPILFVHPEQMVYSDERGETKLDLRPKGDEARVAIVSMGIPHED